MHWLLFMRLLLLGSILLILQICRAADMWPGTPVQTRYENRLLTGLIEHHQMASDLASLAADRAVHTELLNMALIVAWAQQSEISDLRGLLDRWQDVDHEPILTRRDQRTISRLAQLSGEEFERAFMMELIRLDSGALRLGRDCERKAAHQELKTACAASDQKLENEIAQLRQWLCDWYGHCAGLSPSQSESAQRQEPP